MKHTSDMSQRAQADTQMHRSKQMQHLIFRSLAAIALGLVTVSAWGTPATSYYIYDESGHVVGEYDANGNPIQEHVYLGDRPVAVVQGGSSGTVDYVSTDQLNTPRVVTDSNQAVVWTWNSDPFGNSQPTGALTYNLRLPGQYYDAETRHSYNYNRDYDSGTGRYIESDPIGLGGGINTYAYALDNPVDEVDPEGTDAVVATPEGPILIPTPIAPGSSNWAAQGALSIQNGLDYMMSSFENLDSELVDSLDEDETNCHEYCNERLEAELATCRALGRAEGSGRVPKGSASSCYASAQARHWACLNDRPEPPLAGWPQH